MAKEARLEETGEGLAPADQGWFVVNVRDAVWRTHRGKFGSACRFESEQAPFQELGVNIRVLQPGQPNCYYHSESLQEDFLVPGRVPSARERRGAAPASVGLCPLPARGRARLRRRGGGAEHRPDGRRPQRGRGAPVEGVRIERPWQPLS